MGRKNFIYNNLVGIRLLYKMFPKSIILYAVLQMLHGVSWVFQVMSVQFFFDGISEVGAERLVARILLLGIAYAFAQAMNGVANCYGQILNRKVIKETNKILFKAIDRKEAIAFEYAQELDRINKAALGSEGVFWVSTTILDIVFFYAFYFVMMSWYLFSLTPVLSISTVIIFVPNVIARLLHMVSFEKLENEAAPVRRKTEYYAECIVGKEYYKETRLWGCGSYFFAVYNQTLRKLNRLHFRIQVSREKINFAVNILSVSAFGVMIAMLVYYVLTDVISVGAFAAVFAALREFYGFMDEVISERLAVAIENMAMVKNYFAFIKEDKGEQERTELPGQFEIRLDNMSFAYPQPETEKQRFVLSDINLRIPWGQTVALVGENGSGKSTLCHIIAGLYLPVKGTVSYGGIQRGDGRIVSGISSVFQKFCRYHMTLGENIRISDIGSDKSEEELKRICKEIGVAPEWAGELEGMMGREFGGAEVSGGQWQRIAIARGMYRDHRLLILDEPTAAIDALEEKYLYDEFGKLSRSCTSIIVTHRLALAQIADRILVIRDGRIVQDGSHGELMAVPGEYRTMYELQRQWYK